MPTFHPPSTATGELRRLRAALTQVWRVTAVTLAVVPFVVPAVVTTMSTPPTIPTCVVTEQPVVRL
jgi:hypothetical protein